MEDLADRISLVLGSSCLITNKEIEIARENLNSRLIRAAFYPEEWLTSLTDPGNPVSDLELALLKLDIEQALKNNNLSQAKNLNNLLVFILENQATVNQWTPPESPSPLISKTSNQSKQISAQKISIVVGLILLLVTSFSLVFVFRNWLFLYLVIFGLYGAIRVTKWKLVILDPDKFPDTQVYTYIASLPFYDRSFWAGLRPLTVPFFYKCLGNDPKKIVLIQLAFSIVSWGILAWSVANSIPTFWFQGIAYLIILLFSLSAPIVMWDKIILSESFSLSLTALFVANWLWLLEGWHGAKLILLILIGFLWVFSRDTNGYLVLMLSCLLLGVGLQKYLAWDYLAPGIALGSFFVLSNLSSNRTQVNQLLAVLPKEFVQQKGGLFTDTFMGQRWVYPFLNVLTQRIFPVPERLEWFANHGMPVSPALLQFTNQWAHSEAWALYHNPDLQAFREWLRCRGKSTYYHFLWSNRAFFLQEPLRHIENLLAPDLRSYQPQGFSYILPNKLAEFIYPQAYTLLGMWASGLLLGLGIAVMIWQQNVIWAVPIMLILLLYPHILVVWHGDAMEVERHALVAAIQFRLGVWLFLLYLVSNVIIPLI